MINVASMVHGLYVTCDLLQCLHKKAYPTVFFYQDTNLPAANLGYIILPNAPRINTGSTVIGGFEWNKNISNCIPYKIDSNLSKDIRYIFTIYIDWNMSESKWAYEVKE